MVMISNNGLLTKYTSLSSTQRTIKRHQANNHVGTDMNINDIAFNWEKQQSASSNWRLHGLDP